LLYSTIDSSQNFVGIVDKNYRSKMNVTFLLKDSKKENEFLEGAKKQGLEFKKQT